MTITKTILGTILLGAILSFHHSEYSSFSGFRSVAAEAEIVVETEISKEIENKEKAEIVVETEISKKIENKEKAEIVVETKKIISTEVIICEQNNRIDSLEKNVEMANDQLQEVLSLLKNKEEKLKKIKNDKKIKLQEDEDRMAEQKKELKELLFEQFLAMQGNHAPSFSNNLYQYQQPRFSMNMSYAPMSPSDFFRLSERGNQSLFTNFNPGFQTKYRNSSTGNTYIYSADRSYLSEYQNSMARGNDYSSIKIPSFGRNTNDVIGYNFSQFI